MSAGYDGRIIIWDVSAFIVRFTMYLVVLTIWFLYYLSDRYGKVGRFVYMKQEISESLMEAFLRMCLYLKS